MAKTFHSIPWDRLWNEFAAYEGDPEETQLDPRAFADSQVRPVHPFVRCLLTGRRTGEEGEEGVVRDLYFFLLKKRYEERLNLLYFAFYIFEDETRLPEDVLNRTPFPHEDGHPRYGDTSFLDFSPSGAWPTFTGGKSPSD